MNPTTDHPEQICLPGQTHVAQGPHDQTGMYLMHHAFRRDLRRFESAVRETPLGDAATWRAIARRWERFTAVLHSHHQTEDDGMWPALERHAESRGDRAALRTLAAMESEHMQIDPALAACRDALRQMLEHPCEDHRNALDVHVTGTRAALLAHLEHEETQALPYLQLVMTTEEYAAAEAAAKRHYPLRLVPFIVPWVSADVPDDAARRFLSEAGPVYRWLLAATRGRFARGERRAFMYARS